MIAALLLFLLPTRLARLLVPSLRRRIAPGARIGFSWIRCRDLRLAEHASIGHFNMVRVLSLHLAPRAYLGHLNRLDGPFAIALAGHAAIGNRNKATRLAAACEGEAVLALGIWTKITADHRIDLTSSIRFGDYSVLAGTGSQVWTHGYVHAEHGLDRYRIDGEVVVGNNVYIGTMCFISMGVRIADGVIVGGGTSVARDLPEAGLYVSAGLRQLPRPVAPERRADLIAVEGSAGGDIVWRKIGVEDGDGSPR